MLRIWLVLSVVLAAVLAGSTTLACGPGFPWQLLDDRDQTLRDLPIDSFAFSVARLVPKPALRLPQSRESYLSLVTTETEERRTLSAPDMVLVSAMRRQATADAAESMGQALPDETRLYVAGAVAFTHGDYAGAANRFRRVLALPPSGPDRTLWADFMLGRALAARRQDADATDAFRHLRNLVDKGAVDPLGLAVASFGEEARLSLRASGLPMGGGPSEQDASGRGDPGDAAVAHLHQAVTLYSQQAAFGHNSGIDSLQLVAEALLSEAPDRSAWFAAAVRDSLLCHLLVLYALSATGSAPDPDAPYLGQDVLTNDGAFFRNLDGSSSVGRVLDLLSDQMTTANGLDGLDAGRLAALAYLYSRYGLARRFMMRGTGPLAAWVGAKLSLQGDDFHATVLAYDSAVRELAAHPDAMTPQEAGRVRAEDGIMFLARGDFQRAMAILYQFTEQDWGVDDYWGDVAYLAERVLTTNELQRFVAASVPPVALLSDKDIDIDSRTSARKLRELLARRLMRDGRWADAASTFTVTEERQEAAVYADNLLRSRRAFWRTDRARAAWKAALVSRLHGLELFGTETDPDQNAEGARFEHGYGPSHPPSGRWTTAEESWRYAASATVPDRRFHYRFLAVRDAERAVDALPPRSQAFAAVLCRAAGWMFQSLDEADAYRLYRRYLASGAVVPFAVHFGHACPAPDFDAAARLRWREPLDEGVRIVRHHRWPMAGAGATLLLLLLACAAANRRHRA